MYCIEVPGLKIPRSPGKTRDILGCPTRYDYHSPRSKEVLGQLRISRDVLPNMATAVPDLKILEVLGQLRISQKVPPGMTIIVVRTRSRDPK